METITTESPVSIQDTTLIPVVRTFFNTKDNTFTYWLAANKEPLAIIVCNKKGIHAFNMDSAEISIDSLLEKTPGLNEILDPYWRQENS